MTWLLGVLVSFVFLGTRHRPTTVSVYFKVFIMIMVGVLYEALKLHLF